MSLLDEIRREQIEAGENAVIRSLERLGLAPKPETQKEIWLVLDEEGWPIYCAGWPEACHEHINDAINEHDIDGAGKWTVRRAELMPNVLADRREPRSGEASSPKGDGQAAGSAAGESEKG